MRVRAAEFLGLFVTTDPRPTLIDVLKKTEYFIKANLILNTVMLLRDGKPGFAFEFSTFESAPRAKSKLEAPDAQGACILRPGP